VTFAPVVDGWAVPLPPDSAVARGAWNRVPVLVGSTADEGTFLAGETPLRTVAGYTAMLAGYGDARGTLARTYPAADSAAVLPAVQRLAGDMFMGAPARALARLATRGGAPAYLYLFTRVAEGPDAMRGASASHGTDLPFIFGVRAGAGVYRFTGRAAYDSTLAEAMSDYWVAFTASGDPNGAPTSGKWPRWPAYDARTDAYLELGREIVAKRGLRKAEYDVHDALARIRGEVRP
jgi:para-nitrobenzyl esterase